MKQFYIFNEELYHKYAVFEWIENELEPDVAARILPSLEIAGIDYSIIEAVEAKSQGDFVNPLNFGVDEHLDYDVVSIDFETCNSSRMSVCAMGIVLFKDGKVLSRRYRFVKPPREHLYFEPRIMAIHGIKRKDVLSADEFDILWSNEIEKLFSDKLIVFHNSAMEAAALRQLFEYFDIDTKLCYIDTLQVARRINGRNGNRLNQLADRFGLPLDHHNPLSDAEVGGWIFHIFERDFGMNRDDFIRTL